RGITGQEFRRQSHRAKRQADGVLDPLVLRERHLAAATADVDEQGGFSDPLLVAHYSAIDEPSFFETGDDLDIPTRLIPDPGKKGAGVTRIAHRRSSNRTDLVGAVFLHRAI